VAGLDLGQLGELGLIEAVRRRARGARAAGWLEGIGDDAAVLRPRAGCDLVATSDALVEDVHFRWRTTDAVSLGRKALAVNLSDLGAMGARPLGFLLAWGLPESARPDALDGVLAGLLAQARAARCPLVGGDTVRAPVWMLTITALGEVPRGRALLRSAARPGDRILVSGDLGGSALGFHALESGAAERPELAPFAARHLRPAPPWRSGPLLARTRQVHAAIDLSDGLLRDLGHVASASGVRLRVDVDRLPLARGLRSAAAGLGLDPVSLALAGGEDYQLALCVAARAPATSVLARRARCRLTEIGVVERGRGLIFERAGARFEPASHPFEHFKPVSDRSEK
jgi:thiamine-monophosphate kinase